MRAILAAALLAAQFQHPLYIFPDKRTPPRIARQAQPLVKVPAEYTPEARKARISGIVIVTALVEAKGNVSATRRKAAAVRLVGQGD